MVNRRVSEEGKPTLSRGLQDHGEARQGGGGIGKGKAGRSKAGLGPNRGPV